MKIIRTIFSLILIAVVLVSGILLENKLNEYRTALDQKTEQITMARKGRDVDFDKLKSINKDVKAWIWLPDSAIDYPVVQGATNDTYIHRNLYGKYLYDGCIFIDSAVNNPFSKKENTVIYGHHMRSGAMFYDLSNFINKKDYMASHGTFILETEDASYDLVVVAYCNEDAYSDLYNTWFDEPYENFSDNIEEDIDYEEPDDLFTKSDYVDLVKKTAKKLSGVPFDENDAFVTLSTCVYASGDARHQIICIVKPSSTTTKTIITETEKPLINKWLIAQIAVGIIMALVILVSIIPKKKR